MSEAALVRIGTSGYSFDPWKGVFYDQALPRHKMLNAYAAVFDCVELNYTFYGLPRKQVSLSMTRQVPPEFMFVVKANQAFTHKAELSQVPQFLNGIDPIVSAGCFGGLLFQFPAAFKNNPDNRKHIKRLMRVFGDYAMCIEFRHQTWNAEFVRRFLEDNGICHVIPDVPDIPYLYPTVIAATSDIGYIRLHSRNADLWNSGKERYDYDYSEEELKSWLPLLDTMAERSSTIYTFFNNCYRGQAALNAMSFQELIRNAGGSLRTQLSHQQPLKSIYGGLWS